MVTRKQTTAKKTPEPAKSTRAKSTVVKDAVPVRKVRSTAPNTVVKDVAPVRKVRSTAANTLVKDGAPLRKVRSTASKTPVERTVTTKVVGTTSRKQSAKSVTTEVLAATPRKQHAKSVLDHNGPMLSMPDGRLDSLPPSSLLLDPQNLRLLERLGSSYSSLQVKLFGQSAIQKSIYDVIKSDKRFDIQALADSIATSGFLKHERLIVVPYDANNFLVLEGNRRVTAVRSLFEKYGPSLVGLSNDVRESLKSLPCLILDGPAIAGNLEQLKEYRRAAEIYIGMRHLMGAKNWEPASRYEFQSRLIQDEGWTVNDVALRFARKKRDVIRDFQAHLLYQGFINFEKRKKFSHSLTYNAFSEAARATALVRWLEWEEKAEEFKNKENTEVFFKYLVARLGKSTSVEDSEMYDPSELPEVSAETAVRKLNAVLKLGDPDIEQALFESDFNAAELLYEERKEGELPKKIANFTRVLRRANNEDLVSSDEIPIKLRELQLVIEKTLKVITALED